MKIYTAKSIEVGILSYMYQITVKELLREAVDWIYLAEDKDQWRVLV